MSFKYDGEKNAKAFRKHLANQGIFYTSEKLAYSLKALLPENIKEVYDPTCGAGALLSVFDDDVIKYGQELDYFQAKQCCETVKNCTVVDGDTLKKPAFMDRKFEAIIANPPFSISYDRDELTTDIRFKSLPAMPPKSKADYAFIAHILHLLSDTGTAVVLCFGGIFYRGNSEGKIRQWLIENNYIDKLIQYPPNTFTDTKISTIALVLKKNRKTTDVTFEEYEKDKHYVRVVSLDEIKKNNFVLSPGNFIEKPDDKKIINIDEVDDRARKDTIFSLKRDLNIELAIIAINPNRTKKGFIKFLDDIQDVINDFRNKLNKEELKNERNQI